MERRTQEWCPAVIASCSMLGVSTLVRMMPTSKRAPKTSCSRARVWGIDLYHASHTPDDNSFEEEMTDVRGRK